MLTFVMILLAGTTFASLDDKPAVSEKSAATATDPAKRDPESVLREFLIAMGQKNESKLRSLALPHDDFEWLLKGEAVPDEFREKFEAFVMNTPIRMLKAGETLKLPGGKNLTVEPGDVSGDRAMLLLGQDPLPHRLRKVDGKWKIDPSTIIAARKAAASARK